MKSFVNNATVKVPAVTFGFWVIKIFATTLGETGGDAVSMSMDLGYLLSTAIFMVSFVAAVVVQIKAEQFHPFVYWTTIVASTTVGTTMADYATRSLGIGYSGGSALLFALLLACLFTWFRTLGTVSVYSIRGGKAEWFYWLTIMLSQTLGTALGDWTADTAGFGYFNAAMLFGSLLLIVLGMHHLTRTPKTTLFWAAFVLTRPLGAVIGDFLDKPVANGGLELSRYTASATLFVAIAILILVLPQKPAEASH